MIVNGSIVCLGIKAVLLILIGATNIPDGIGADLYGYRKRNWDNCSIDTSGSGNLTIVSKKENYLGEVWNWPLCTDDSCNMGVGYHACDYSHTPPKCWDVDNVWFKHTTNQLISHEKFKYGYFEIRCKIPIPSYPKTNTGVGPNFWLWWAEGDVSWSEIDIFEFDGSNNKFGSAIHYEDAHGDTLHGIPDHPPLITVGDSKYHKYAVHWEPHELKFYFDDQLYLTTRLYADDLVAMPMIIDVNFPLHTMCQLLNSNTQLPHQYVIDYVKVYQLKYDCNGDYHICNNTGTDLIDYEDVSIGGAGCNPKVTSGNTLDISSNSISVDGSVTIEVGGQLNYSYSPCYESFHIMPTTAKSATIPTSAPESYYKRLNQKYHEY